MFAGYQRARRARRGVVLIVVLGMLGLLALIGVTFATFSAQARISARNFSMSQNFPDSTEVMDFALSQLIDDTYNPVSAIRGHSLKRDMYGNDAAFNGYLAARPDNGNSLIFTNIQQITTGSFAGLFACTLGAVDGNGNTSTIAYNDPAFYGYYDFTRWVIRVPGAVVPIGLLATGGTDYKALVSETFEVIADDYSGLNSGSRVLYVTPHDGATGIANYFSPYPTGTSSGAATQSVLHSLGIGVPFVLDGRYLRAFNGPGLSDHVSFTTSAGTFSYPANVYGNFRLNGVLLNGRAGGPNVVPSLAPLGDPNAVGMDEDYDACDLDNWFLAIQSADGQVVIPSFHRPAVIRANPASTNNPPNTTTWSSQSESDWTGSTADSMARILRPRNVDHRSLSFPDLYPDANGRITYDVDNDGDGITDSVWLDLGYPAKRDPTGQLFKPLFSFLVIGLNGRLPLNTAGNLQLRDNESNATSGAPTTTPGQPFIPLHAHASRLGYSPSEIDPCYALQNAAGPAFSQNDSSGSGGTPTNTVPNLNFATNGIPVNLTQLRNILTGTRPQYGTPSANGNGDANYVYINGQAFYMPNNVYDASDLPNGSGVVQRLGLQVEGRWGEGDFVPVFLSAASSTSVAPFNFGTAIRAGLSLAYGAMEDDNYTQFDPSGKAVDTYDSAGGMLLPVERYRRFTTPLDVSGNGMLGTFNNATGLTALQLLPPTGMGPDPLGRVGYYLHYRPNSYPTVYVLGYNQPSKTPDTTTNPYHGFDAAFNPLVTATKFNNFTALGAADGRGGGPNPLGNNEADEMRLYTPNEYDNGFDVGDLQWLYRSQDSDGASLTSRLAQLAPVSFLNPQDGPRRRRLFALDSWETTNFVWAPDNPGGAFPDNSRFVGNVANPNNPGGNGSPVFMPYTANASFANLNLTSAVISGMNILPYPFGYFSPLAPYGAQNAYPSANQVPAATDSWAARTLPTPVYVTWPIPTPPLAHRDRKINLNFPLPVSNSQDEPVRQKWITNTYYLLKSVLPPQSVDTPAELAQLSQFVINIVDFRDPDATMTHWQNPDLQVLPPPTPSSGAGGSTPPQLVLTSSGTTGAIPLDQYGMENLPIAINEVLAYSFLRKDYDTGSMQCVARPTNRFFVELVNTLTQSQTAPVSSASGTTLNVDPSDGYSYGSGGTTTSLDLTNWDMVITEDTPATRPDPTTGQLLAPANTKYSGVYGPVQITPNSFIDFTAASTPATVRQPVHVPALTNGTTVPPNPTPTSGSASGTGPQTQYAWNYYFVIGNLLPVIAKSPQGGTDGTTPCEKNAPLATNPKPDQMVTFVDGSTASTKSLTETDLFDSYAASSASGSLLTNSDQPGTSPDNTLVDKKNNSKTLFQVPQLPSSTAKYMWLYLRRPANPFAPINETPGPNYNPGVVVDCMRFTYIEGGGTIAQADISQTDFQDGTGMPKKVTAGANPIYSTQRLQPLRGGHAIGVLPANGNDIITAYGYSEQTVPASSTSNASPVNYGVFGNQQFTANIWESLGQPNGPNVDTTWEHFPFHDRDFASVAELLLVPGCPPGLFTKQFVENTSSSFTPTPPIGSPSAGTVPTNVGTQLAAGPRSYPYLNDNFFYTAASPQVLNPNPGATPGGPIWPVTGGPSGAGWHKMLEFFEVPSSALGAIGPVATGTNYDWAREDTKPGLLNLNLIVDEEVWLGLMGNAGLMNTVANLTSIPMMNSAQMLTSSASRGYGQPDPAIVPQVVTLTTFDPKNGNIDSPYPMSAYPPTSTTRVAAYPVSNVGFYTTPPGSSTGDNRMKAAFSDFLKLRHGGSGYMFAWGTGQVGSTPPVAPVAGSPASERPFRSLSFPDIDYTIMRPAALPPSSLTTPTWNGPLTTATQPAAPNFGWDPGVKNPYGPTGSNGQLYPYLPVPPATGDGYPNSHGVVGPPPIPPRRLFQIADAPPGAGPSSNASVLGDTSLNTLIAAPMLSNHNFDLTSGASAGIYLGTTTGDNRQRLSYRMEWLQKVMNLTTVRTHQYAVWITVAFFEVVKQGDPTLASTQYWAGAIDILGDELNVSTGRNIRYRSFFLLDRTRATGFNPGAPGDFRNVVVYRQTIQ